jgi:glycosyltransferase involved in cell wall biosynthesis
VPALLAAADVAVAPSVHDDAGNVDGLPNTVMEIMASGAPLVATPAGGIGAVATDRVTARLVPERDVHALASAIDELLRDRAAAMLMGRQARDFVCRHHSWARVAENFDAVYARC